MNLIPETLEQLRNILGGFDDSMVVEADPDSGIHAKTVGELRRIARMPAVPITVAIPVVVEAESVVKITMRR